MISSLVPHAPQICIKQRLIQIRYCIIREIGLQSPKVEQNKELIKKTYNWEWWSHKADCLISISRIDPFELLYASVLQFIGWNSADVITSAQDKIDNKQYQIWGKVGGGGDVYDTFLC